MAKAGWEAMVNAQALFIPESPSVGRIFLLARSVCAISLERLPTGRVRLGSIVSLPEGAPLEICGEGFNERTVKIKWRGNCYFVLLEDVDTVNAKQESPDAQ